MERSFDTISFSERLLGRWGGSYLVRMQFMAFCLAGLSAVIGTYYIIVAASLNNKQIIQLIVSLIVFGLLTCLSILLFTTYTTTTSRARIDNVIKGIPIQKSLEPEQVISSVWQEIYSLPSRILLVEIMSFILLLILPVFLFMRWVGSVEIYQGFHIILGSSISGASVVIINTLLLERILTPIQKLLFTPKIEINKPSLGSKIQVRLQGIIAYLVIITITLLAGIGFQRSINATLPDANVSFEIAQFQREAVIIGFMILILGLILGRMISRSISQPVNEILSTMDSAQVGKYVTRAQSYGFDEISVLTQKFNRLLDQLHLSQSNLEKQVEDRTADLRRRTTQLQAATRVSQDTSTAQDLHSLLSRTVQLITDYFGYYHVGIYLLDSSGESAILRAASSEGGKKMIARGYKLEVGQRSPVGMAANENVVHIIGDATKDPSYLDNPDLPKTISQIAIPLAPRGNMIGVLDIQSVEKTAFSTDDQGLLRTLADQMALAIQNVQLIEENRLALERMEAVLTENVRRAWGESGEEIRAYRYTPTGLTKVPLREDVKASNEGVVPLTVPITLRGQRIGSIELIRKGEVAWSDTDRSLVNEISSQIGLALENSRLLKDAQQHALYEKALSDLTTKLGLSVDPDILLQTAIRELHQLPNTTEVSVILTTPESASSKD